MTSPTRAPALPLPRVGEADPAIVDGEIAVSARRRALRQLRRDRAAMGGLALLLAILVASALVPLFVDGDPKATDLAAALQGLGEGGHLLGTDELGRDVLLRLAVGTRNSLFTGVGAVAVAVVVGVPLGLVAGYLRGRADEVLMTLVEILMALPGVLLAMLMVAALGPSRRNLILAVGLTGIPVFARLVRGSAMALREREFVEAARSMGAGPVRIMVTHILPGCVPAIVVTAVLGLGTAIITVAGLGFLGLGGDPSTPEWGAMLRQGLEYMRQGPHLVLAPGALILLTILSLNLFGDGLTDAINPELRRHRKARNVAPQQRGEPS